MAAETQEHNPRYSHSFPLQLFTNPQQHVHVSNVFMNMVPMSDSTYVSKPSFQSYSSTVDCSEAGAYRTSGLNSLDAAEDACAVNGLNSLASVESFSVPFTVTIL